MTEQNWDASRKAFRKRANILISIVIPLCIVCGIIFYNNRDVLSIKSERVVVEPVEKRSGFAEEKADTFFKSVDSVKTKFIDLQKLDNQVGKKIWIRDSVRVSGIEISPEDRNDVRLRLTLEVFFNDLDMRTEILLRREEIRVTARRILDRRSMSLIKKEIVEPQLREAIDRIFDNKNLVDVKIVDLQIEKVQAP